MNLVPNAFLLYVADVERSTKFYESIFDLKAVFTSPFYVAFEPMPGVTFALWSRHDKTIPADTLRTSEIGFNGNMSPAEMDALYDQWLAKGATAIDPPYDDQFGHTFVVADPDGNLIRVAPAD